VNEKTIREHIGSGLLKPAIRPDGLLDPLVADDLLARGRTRGRDVAPDLEEARRRKLAAQCRLLDDEVQDLRRSRATPATLAEMFGFNYRAFAAGCAPVARAAATLAKAEPIDAFTVLTEAVYATLTDLSERRLDCDGPDQTDDAIPAGVAFDRLDAIQLAATKTDLEGERLELVRATKRGDLVPIAVAMSGFGDRITYFRGRMLGLPSRTAPLYQSAMTADEAATVAIDIIDEALFSFAGDEITHEALKQELRVALDVAGVLP
jgi:hypothetical protein